MNPSQNLSHAVNPWPVRHIGAVDQDDGQVQVTRRIQLCTRPRTAGVLCDDMGDAMGLQQGQITLQRKGSARDQGRGLGQRQRGGLVDQPQKVMVLGLYGEIFQILAADGQEYPCRIIGQGRDGTRHIGHALPIVTFGRLPRCAFKRHQRGLGDSGGLNCMAAHLGGKGVGGVNQVGDGFIAQIARQTGNAAKAANALGQGLAQGGFSASGVRENRVNTLISQSFRQIRSLGRAAKQKDAGHG